MSSNKGKQKTPELVVSEFEVAGDEPRVFDLDNDIVATLRKSYNREPERFYVRQGQYNRHYTINRLQEVLPNGGECKIQFALAPQPQGTPGGQSSASNTAQQQGSSGGPSAAPSDFNQQHTNQPNFGGGNHSCPHCFPHCQHRILLLCIPKLQPLYKCI